MSLNQPGGPVDDREAKLQSLQDAFHDLQGYSDMALLSEVVAVARQRFEFAGDEESAIHLLIDARDLEMVARRDPQTESVGYFVRRRRRG